MSQHDYVIANGTGAAVRSDLNGALAAIVTQNSGATAPATTYAYQWWADTTTGLLKIRNAANNAWVTIGSLSTAGFGLLAAGDTLTAALGSASTPGITFTGDTNTGIYSPGADQVAVATNGTQRLTVDTAATTSTLPVVHPLGAVGTPSLTFTGDLNTGIWSPAADTIAFSKGGVEAMRIDSSGRVGIGTTSVSALLHLRGSTPELRIDGDSTSGTGGLKIYSSATELANFTYSNVTGENRIGGIQSYVFPTFYSGGSERARIDTSGRLLVGTSTGSGNNLLQIQGESGSSAGIGGIVLRRGLAPSLLGSGSIMGRIDFGPNDGGVGASIVGEGDAQQGTNDYPSRLVFSTTADGASSPTERMRITSAGDLLVNTTTVSFAQDKAWVSTNLASNEGIISQGYLAAAAYFNRRGNDGTIINLLQGVDVEGTISVSGTTVSYNGAHLSRWSQLPGNVERTEILRGSVLSNIDEMCEWGEEDNEQLNRMKVSDVEGDKNVSGVFQCWDDDDDTYTNDFYCAMTGDFIIRIAEGVTVERGDLLMSAGDGTAKPQDDDIIRSKTIAKVTSTNVSCTYEDGSYCVPCVLMAC